jgi:sulfatase maturation enzyme AslB (radical SAM superfamily)
MLSNLFKRKEAAKPRDPSQSDFCYYPFFQVLLSADGKYMPCSHHDNFITESGEEITVKTHTIEEAWNSEYMKTLRTNFNNNVRSPGCNQCWKEQALGLKPMRFDSYGYGITEQQVQKPLSPKRVEINASNVCNLRCRICGPHASSRWIKEAKELYSRQSELHFNMTPENQHIIRKWVPQFDQIGFFGGEPLMAEENIDLMRYCVETGHASHISLLINTNATIYTDELVSLFKQFKNVFLNLSIDDIGDRFEYQRSGAKWNEVLENLTQYSKHGGYTGTEQIQIKICCSVTAMNIYYFPEYFHFMNEHFPGLPVFWNLVYAPAAMSMQIFPAEIKKIIAERLSTQVHATYEFIEMRTRTVENLISYLNGSIENDFQDFFDHINRHDKFRHESFRETFPEFWEIIKGYEKQAS